MADKFPPDFNLDPLTKFSVDTFFSASGIEDHHAFVLAVSTAFNDLKDYYWMYQQLIDNRPQDLSQIEPRCGQWNGMAVFVVRKILATFYEFLDLLDKKGSSLEHQSIKDALALMGPTSKKAWDTLIAMAQKQTQELPPLERSVYTVVMRVRHNVTSHYYGTENFAIGFKGYCDFQKENAAVYASMGDTMEATRFFYADAACQNFIDKIHSDNKINREQVLTSVKMMNEACRQFLEAFLKVSSRAKLT